MKDIDFTSAKKFKENLDNKIDSWDGHMATYMVNFSQTLGQVGQPKANSPSAEEIAVLFEKLNQCKIKPVALSLVGPYADQFVVKSCTVPVVTDLYATGNLGLKYPELVHCQTVLTKLEAFWRICVLPEILGRWYIRRCTLPINLPDGNGRHTKNLISCCNKECPYVDFHCSCLALDTAAMPKIW